MQYVISMIESKTICWMQYQSCDTCPFGTSIRKSYKIMRIFLMYFLQFSIYDFITEVRREQGMSKIKRVYEDAKSNKSLK